jgi:hypothetical protein
MCLGYRFAGSDSSSNLCGTLLSELFSYQCEALQVSRRPIFIRTTLRKSPWDKCYCVTELRVNTNIYVQCYVINPTFLI